MLCESYALHIDLSNHGTFQFKTSFTFKAHDIHANCQNLILFSRCPVVHITTHISTCQQVVNMVMSRAEYVTRSDRPLAVVRVTPASSAECTTGQYWQRQWRCWCWCNNVVGKLGFRAEETSNVQAFIHLVFPSDGALISLRQFKPSLIRGTFCYLQNFQTKLKRRIVCAKLYKKAKRTVT